jgi:RNA polymerase sigma-70 factor (ECF subfamily)
MSLHDPASQHANATDEVLALQAAKDIRAFEVLILRYESRLLRFIIRISSSGTAQAEEILQEVFLKLWKNINDFDAAMPFSSWIYRITRNQVISQHRKNISRGDHEKVSYDPALFDLHDEASDFTQHIDAQHRAQLIREALEQMPSKFKDVLVLRYLESKNYEEIADILRKPPGTVATLLSRAKKSFQTVICTQAPSIIPPK